MKEFQWIKDIVPRDPNKVEIRYVDKPIISYGGENVCMNTERFISYQHFEDKLQEYNRRHGCMLCFVYTIEEKEFNIIPPNSFKSKKIKETWVRFKPIHPDKHIDKWTS